MKQIKKYRISLILAMVGIVAGVLYWRFIGCRTGTCAIKSVWYNMAIYGGLLGFLTGDLIRDKRKKNK